MVRSKHYSEGFTETKKAADIRCFRFLEYATAYVVEGDIINGETNGSLG
jgi:hypothetical protein